MQLHRMLQFLQSIHPLLLRGELYAAVPHLWLEDRSSLSFGNWLRSWADAL
jgi:hypothetical protein